MRPRTDHFERRAILKEMEIGNKNAYLWASLTVFPNLRREAVDGKGAQSSLTLGRALCARKQKSPLPFLKP